MLFVGDDWGRGHHDIEIVDDDGRRLARRRIPEGVQGLAALHALVADHLGEGDHPGQVMVGIETDRGPVGVGDGGGQLHRVRGEPAAGCPLPAPSLKSEPA